MKIIKTKLDGVVVIEPTVYGDHRGFFMESFNERVLREQGFEVHFVQDNHSLSVAEGTLRGLHYQLDPMSQTKLVRVLTGSIYDVVVDIRRGSPTYGQWASFELSAENKKQLLIPRGFAHGFCTTSPDTEVLYKVDQYYAPELDRGILWNDPDLNINWPVSEPILSDRDARHPRLKDAEINFTYVE